MKETYEIYAEAPEKITAPDLDPDQESKLLAFQQQKTLAEELGLTAMTKRVEREQALVTMRGVATPTPLSEDELTVWSAWLPRVYSNSTAQTTMSDYRFDLIPVSILETWKKWKQTGCFEEFEIRTPEASRTQDPILLGVRDNKRYLLARWSESDERLISFAEIAKQVKASLQKDMRRFRTVFFICAPVAAIAFSLFSMSNPETMNALNTSLVVTGTLSAFGAFVSGVCWFLERIDRGDRLKVLKRVLAAH